VPRQLKDLLNAYNLFTSKSDSPQVFHVWCALGAIAGAAQRKIYMHTMYFDVHTNLYIILVSPPGRAKKGAALRTSKNFLKAVEPKVNFATESSSPEGIVKLLSKISNPAHQSMTIYSMEMGTLMSTRPGEMVDFLTDIYDGNPDWERQTVAHDKQTITRPWLNIMAGTTPKWLGDKLGLIALEGGMVARCIFPYSEDRILNNPWPRPTPELQAVGEAITQDLSHIATLEGEFEFDGGEDGEAYKYYESWYKDHSRFPKMEDPRTASYYDRKHIHLLKVAMALSLSYKDELLIRLEDLKRGMALLDSTEPGMHKALGSAGKNPLAAETLRVAAMVHNKQTVSYRELLVANYHDLGKKDLDTALEYLRVTGRVKQEGNNYVWIGGSS
jgi:hypothetical protein